MHPICMPFSLSNSRRISLKKQSITALFASLCAGVAFTIASPAAFAAASNTIVVGADTTFPPFETEKDGKVTGFDIDMIKAIAKAENLTVKIKTMPFNGIIPSLQSGSIDAAVAGITIKTSRMKNVNFSNAYYKSGLSVMVRADSKIKGFDDLKGHVVATKKATSSVDYMRDHGIDAKYIKQFQNIDAAYQALVTGGADAVVFDNPVNVNFKVSHKQVKIVGKLLTGEYYGIAVTKKEPALLKKINAGLAKIKKDGTYDKLFDTYFAGDANGKVQGVKTPSAIAVKD
jgi:polar amino acid transport system substrate-binding protein/glutamine transport system substrate-binding protein